jgi:N-acetylneuraminate lyase
MKQSVLDSVNTAFAAHSGAVNADSRLKGFIAAPHTPFHPDGRLNLSVVPLQAEILERNAVAGAFICGTTGESHSLTTAERTQNAEAWKQALRSRNLKLIVHAGHNCVEDAKALAAHAQAIAADAVAIMAPSYFKPASVQELVDFCAPIASAASKLPFYFYDIPCFTGVSLPMPDFLKQASPRIPNLAGLKFTQMNLVALQQCLHAEDGRFNILFGVDEMLLAALALGVTGAVGSTYNFAAPLYKKLMSAFQAGDLAAARALQFKSVRLVEVLCQYGGLPAGKAVMAMLGADCGPVRLPLRQLNGEEIEGLRKQIRSLDILSNPLPRAFAH